MKYASKLGKMNLTDKIAEVVSHKIEEKERGLQNGHVDDTYMSRYSVLTYSLLWDLV
jgi:homoserine trans-succinylase